MNSCSCLTLLLACVVYWQAKEISRVPKMGIPEGEDIDLSLLEHVSPIEWENVILYGQYVLNPGPPIRSSSSNGAKIYSKDPVLAFLE
jgi:hypothetical protein